MESTHLTWTTKTRMVVPLMTQFNQKSVKYVTMLLGRGYKYPQYNAITLGWKCWKTSVGIEILLIQWGDAPKRPSVFAFQGGRTWKEVNFEQNIRDKIVMLLGRPWGTHWERKKSYTLLMWYVKWNISFHILSRIQKIGRTLLSWQPSPDHTIQNLQTSFILCLKLFHFL
jgi:hypothetical protein